MNVICGDQSVLRAVEWKKGSEHPLHIIAYGIPSLRNIQHFQRE